jgi:hypothetical protein
MDHWIHTGFLRAVIAKGEGVINITPGTSVVDCSKPHSEKGWEGSNKWHSYC